MKLPNFQLPNQKEWAAGVAGLVTWAIMLGLSYVGIDVPVQAQTGLSLLVAVAIAKFTPASDQDVLQHVNDTIAQAGTLIGKLTPASDTGAPITPAAAKLASKAS